MPSLRPPRPDQQLHRVRTWQHVLLLKVLRQADTAEGAPSSRYCSCRRRVAAGDELGEAEATSTQSVSATVIRPTAADPAGAPRAPAFGIDQADAPPIDQADVPPPDGVSSKQGVAMRDLQSMGSGCPRIEESQCGICEVGFRGENARFREFCGETCLGGAGGRRRSGSFGCCGAL